ncbi:hypothetical protein Scep_001554 [Stephania cephalantha]|uniref:Uncharacterized protein n=1 Tax=Stephania cephalantha TaxID=152367 RepID=A0AAP0L892_9MAGN
MLKPWWLLINQFRIYKGLPALKQLCYQWRPDSLTLKLFLPKNTTISLSTPSAKTCSDKNVIFFFIKLLCKQTVISLGSMFSQLFLMSTFHTAYSK